MNDLKGYVIRNFGTIAVTWNIMHSALLKTIEYFYTINKEHKNTYKCLIMNFDVGLLYYQLSDAEVS